MTLGMIPNWTNQFIFFNFQHERQEVQIEENRQKQSNISI